MRRNIINLFLSLFVVLGVTSCSDDELGPTIFPHLTEDLDKGSATYQLDKFIYDNYLLNYNMRFDYRMSDTEADMNYNLIPASYSKSVDMAVLTKYLWYDVYEKAIANSTSDVVDKFFMKRYGPKMIMLVGVAAYNASSGTKVLGLAENGVKITLFNVDSLDINDSKNINERFFKTMHHEFSHVLHQNVAFSDDFKKISSGLYDPLNWQDKADEDVRSKGFITPYGSSDYNEDFVETIALYIVSTDEEWNTFMEQASIDYEELEVDAIGVDSEYQRALNDGTFIRIMSSIKTATGQMTSCKILRKAVEREYAEGDKVGVPIKDPETGDFIYKEVDKIDGKAVIEQKLNAVSTYLMDFFGIDLNALRHEVLSRTYVTKPDGSFLIKDGQYVNKLTYPAQNYPTVMDSLRSQVYSIPTE